MEDRAGKITNQIIDDAKAKVKLIKDDALSKAKEVEDKAKVEADKKKEQIIDQANKDAQEQKRRIIGMAQLETRKEMLAAKQEIISAVLDRLMDNLAGMDDQTYLELMEKLLFRVIERGDETIVCSSRDRQRIADSFWVKINKELVERGKKGALVVSPQTRDIAGGFIALSAGVEINCSFESLLEMKKEELESEVAAILFK